MSAAPASTNSNTTKATTNEPPTGSTLKDQQKPAAALEEDDEFEDFPVDGPFILSAIATLGLSHRADGLRASITDWPASEQVIPGATAGGASEENANATTHLWEESWDDDDTSEDFSKQLKYVHFQVRDTRCEKAERTALETMWANVYVF